MTAEFEAGYRSWEMWAQLRHGTEFQHIGSRSYADACGTPDPVPVTVTEVPHDDPGATHWGWIRLTHWRPLGSGTEPIPPEGLRPEMIWRHRAAFDTCFPYGPQAEEERGKGRIARLRITARELAGDDD